MIVRNRLVNTLGVRGGYGWRRTQEEIMLDILQIATTPTGRTRLMSLANTAWHPFQKYVSRLKSLDLLNETTRGRGVIYFTTEKGKDALRKREALWKDLGIKYEP